MKCVRDRRRRTRLQIIRGVGSSRARCITRDVGKFLFERKSVAEVEDAHYKHHQQGQRNSKLHQLRGALVAPSEPGQAINPSHWVSIRTRADAVIQIFCLFRDAKGSQN